MDVLPDSLWMRQILLPIWNAEKAAFKKAQHPDRKMIYPFFNPAGSMDLLPVPH
jgi:hypothetical protein